MEELEALKKNSLALGASQKNAIAIKDNEILNKEGLRSKDELVKHKILDVIGDLYLLQHNLIGEFVGYKSGHTQNNLLLRKLIEVPDSWELISSDSDNPIIDYIEPIIDPSLG
jgi:UDP-3-O-[3-hydroxymyristoyl] N-acetylglucosamine deacetylase